LEGFEYSAKENGNYRNNYGVDSRTIFSMMKNKNYLHDLGHYYSGQIYRNWREMEPLDRYLHMAGAMTTS